MQGRNSDSSTQRDSKCQVDALRAFSVQTASHIDYVRGSESHCNNFTVVFVFRRHQRLLCFCQPTLTSASLFVLAEVLCFNQKKKFPNKTSRLVESSFSCGSNRLALCLILPVAEGDPAFLVGPIFLVPPTTTSINLLLELRSLCRIIVKYQNTRAFLLSSLPSLRHSRVCPNIKDGHLQLWDPQRWKR